MPDTSTTEVGERSPPSQCKDAQHDALPPPGASKNQRVVLITGAASGIGRQLIIQLARRGWKTVGLDENLDGLEKLQEKLGAETFSCRATDVTDSASLEIEVAKLVNELGHVDLLIAAAGIATPTPALAMEPETIARIINVNLLGISNIIAAVLPGMLARRSGHIVAISSLASYRGLPEMMGYCASKAGLNALMESLWLDVKAHGLSVTTVCPGHTRTLQTEGVYEDRFLMSVEQTAAEILKAIDRRKRFHAFPWQEAMQLRLMRLLPGWLQDWLLVRRMNEVKKK